MLTFPLIQNGYFMLHDVKPSGGIMGTFTSSGQTHPKY